MTPNRIIRGLHFSLRNINVWIKLQAQDAICWGVFLRILYALTGNLNVAFTRKNPYSVACFIEGSIMDVVFVLGAVGLWLAMVLMVVGLQKLEKPEVKRS